MLMRYTHRVGEGGWLIKPLIFLFSVLRIGGQLGELPDPQLLSGVERLSSLTPPPLVSINTENVQPSQPPIQLYTGEGLVPPKQAKAGLQACQQSLSNLPKECGQENWLTFVNYPLQKGGPGQ